MCLSCFVNVRAWRSGRLRGEGAAQLGFLGAAAPEGWAGVAGGRRWRETRCLQLLSLRAGPGEETRQPAAKPEGWAWLLLSLEGRTGVAGGLWAGGETSPGWGLFPGSTLLTGHHAAQNL